VSTINLDVAVVGGGIAGLWISSVLQAAGYNIALFEQTALGSVQTLASQGIIHGGTKYALTGKLTGSSEAVRAMPGRWKQHLAGERQPDLSASKINTPHQWMWDAGGISSKISSFFASKLMSSRVQQVSASQLPDLLQGKGVYQLQEPVLDVQSVLQILSGGVPAYQAKVTTEGLTESGHLKLTAKSAGQEQSVVASLVVNAAGKGNEELQKAPMQVRPLHMVMVKGDLPAIWGHVIEANANPRITMTSHIAQDGQTVWYIGGQLAESGVAIDAQQQIAAAKKELNTIFPGINCEQMAWATLKIDRAEGQQSDGSRPSKPVIHSKGKQITVWPTKLVFAPMVADEVMQWVKDSGLQPSQIGGDVNQQNKLDLPVASVGIYPWDSAEWY
jgi:glycerol-3-phosphate dehydrogenase